MTNPSRVGLFRPDILACLLDRDAFVDLIAREFYEHAQDYQTHVVCSKMRLYHAHQFFIDDIRGVKSRSMPIDTEDLDHFKVGAYVGFWLRRMLPINHISALTIDGRTEFDCSNPDALTGAQKHFMVYGNEISSFRVAFDIVLYSHSERLRVQAEQANVTVADRPASLIAPSIRTFKEIVVTLKHKSNSPHSFYISLLSLFEGLRPVSPN